MRAVIEGRDGDGRKKSDPEYFSVEILANTVYKKCRAEQREQGRRAMI